MSVAILIMAGAISALLGLCYRELRAIRRGLGALDESEGRRAVIMVGELSALRGLLRINPRETAVRAPAAGLRLACSDVEEHDSESDTRVMRPPTAAELAAAGAVPPRPREGKTAAGP